MKKYFNYIFIFVVCFVFIGEAKAIKFDRVSREEFESSKSSLVFCGLNREGKEACGPNPLPSSLVKVERLYNDGTERALGVNSNSANIGDGKNYSYTNTDRIRRKNFDFITIPKNRINSGPVSIAAYYNNIGKYKGEYINVKVIYTVYLYGNWAKDAERNYYEHADLKKYHLAGFEGLIIMIPHVFRGSVGFFHSAYDKVRYEFTDQNGNPVNIQNGKFLMMSLNDKTDPLNESVFFPVRMSNKITKYEYVNKYLHTERSECRGTPNNLTLLDGGSSGTTRSDPKNVGHKITYGSAIVPKNNNCFFEDNPDIRTDDYANAAAIWFNSNYIEFYFASYKGNDPNGFELENFEIMFRPSSGSEYITIKDDYDYSIDMACTNCSSTLKSNKAIYIQDTTDWEAITNSGNSSCTNAENYFETRDNSGIYCRSEYEIIYPNKDDIITVYTGRFFTLNATDDAFQRAVGTDKFVHNFKPISVTKKMECKGNIGGQENVLKDYFLNEGENADNSGGTIKLTYTDNKKKTYDFEDEPLKSKLDGEVSVSNSGDMITLLGKYYFTLPDDFYRYVQKKDAFSIRKSETIEHDNPANYRYIEISNIPIPFNDHKTGDEVSTTFKYTLPSKSKIRDAVEKEKSNYFGCPEDVQIDNLYKKAKASNSNDMLKETACYKLFGKASLTDECVTNGLSKTINCLKDDYTCNLPVSDSKTPPCDPKKEVCKVCDPTKEICDGDECNPNLKCCEDCVEDFSKVIYRVINVDNPFTYENGKIRNTGINWCSETANDGKIDCSGNNKTVLSKITDKKNISESEALYVIDLTSDNIKSLRGYNENHSYEYYNCDKNVSDFCRSEILSGTSSSARNLVINGKCRDNYKTCTD